MLGFDAGAAEEEWQVPRLSYAMGLARLTCAAHSPGS